VCNVYYAGNCGQTVAQTGFLTEYTYDAQGSLLTVVQNAPSSSTQTRTYTYDGFRRLIEEANPGTNEAAKSYTYDSDATWGNVARRSGETH
jgi:YD repeat-containing protein